MRYLASIFGATLVFAGSNADGASPLAGAENGKMATGSEQTAEIEDALMGDDKFWRLIEETRSHEADPEKQLEVLRSELNKLTADEIDAYDLALDRQMHKAYSGIYGAPITSSTAALPTTASFIFGSG